MPGLVIISAPVGDANFMSPCIARVAGNFLPGGATIANQQKMKSVMKVFNTLQDSEKGLNLSHVIV